MNKPDRSELSRLKDELSSSQSLSAEPLASTQRICLSCNRLMDGKCATPHTLPHTRSATPGVYQHPALLDMHSFHVSDEQLICIDYDLAYRKGEAWHMPSQSE